MTDAERVLPILELNSGSSSLKFGLYRVGFARSGPRLQHQCPVDDEVPQQLEAAIAIAPLHIP
jgi:acetate kinase